MTIRFEAAGRFEDAGRSAPCFTFDVIDPLTELSELAPRVLSGLAPKAPE